MTPHLGFLMSCVGVETTKQLIYGFLTMFFFTTVSKCYSHLSFSNRKIYRPGLKSMTLNDCIYLRGYFQLGLVLYLNILVDFFEKSTDIDSNRTLVLTFGNTIPVPDRYIESKPPAQFQIEYRWIYLHKFQCFF